jgi:hypothetical protein
MHINGSFVTTPVGGSSARSTVEKLSTRTTAVLASPRMTTSRISEKSSPTQPSNIVDHENEYQFTVDLTSS